MCRQYYTFYTWCQCEVDAGQNLCVAFKRNDCEGLSIETVHMHCFCNHHASKGFKSEKKSKKPKRSSAGSSAGFSLEEKSSTTSRKWYQFRGLRSRTF
ncbi:uncharacterized protein ACLA_054100 [Aspergillus clavatus NRRL 1]|uniref:Uncharacterized protein n=1 Tax=Aspergillus clavatus (strain ATCC 1007 / CBS 513.65 / DSM 816 / NCTC 3887 / NRRL 1 / QM 1276 / 107) TaxID=344612 RepID=A1C939_ASPCL|nr:uncharacterized protein ACLA_054100 [Aspergillus clavatus NRRL 1]EAW13363.1 conserved hypothetical protein [Aspergillus clavatus NRRL 1]